MLLRSWDTSSLESDPRVLRRVAGCSRPRARDCEGSVAAVAEASRIVVMGPSAMRLALERAYVALYRWPDRLIDIEHSDWIGEQNLVERLRRLADTVEG